MSGDKTCPEPDPKSSVSTSFRTYSRHGRDMKRKSTSIREHLSHWDALTKDDSKPDSGPHRHLKRARTYGSLQTSPTDVFWEHLSASAPISTRPQKADEEDIGVSLETDQSGNGTDSATPDEVEVKYEPLASEDVNDQWSRVAPLEVAAPEDQEKNGCIVYDGGKDFLQRDLLEDAAFMPYQVSSVKRGRLLRRSPSPTTVKTARARQFPDVDESLLVVNSSPASILGFRIPIASDTNGEDGLHIQEDTKSKHLVDGFDSPAGPWPIPTPTGLSKYLDVKQFKKLGADRVTKAKRSSDGFERDETRPTFLGKKRRIESNDLNIGFLETTQKGIATQKIDGPTWLRGQKKPRVSTETSLWSSRRYLGISKYNNQLHESSEVHDNQKLKSSHASRARSKRRISRIVINDDQDDDDQEEEEEPVILLADLGEVDDHNDSAYDDVEVARSPPAEHGEPIPDNADADEPLDLLIFTFDEEDEANFTIPRTDPLEPGVNADRKLAAQLPPKCWMLDELEDDQDTLALRPNSRAWKREVSHVPNTSDL